MSEQNKIQIVEIETKDFNLELHPEYYVEVKRFCQRNMIDINYYFHEFDLDL